MVSRSCAAVDDGIDSKTLQDVLRSLTDVKGFLQSIFPSCLIKLPATPAASPEKSVAAASVRRSIQAAGLVDDDLLRVRTKALAALRCAGAAFTSFVTINQKPAHPLF